MPAYVIGQVQVSDAEQFKQYQALAPASIQQYGGRYLVRGGALEHLEHQWDVPRLVILEFPDMDSARAWYNSPEYAEAKQAREGAAELTLTLVEGL